jgi:hypothetical protein
MTPILPKDLPNSYIAKERVPTSITSGIISLLQPDLPTNTTYTASATLLKRESFRHSMMELPLVKPDVRQVAVVPTANGPRAVTQSGRLMASWIALLSAKSRHGSGSEVIHCSDKASSRQVTIVSPNVFELMRSVPKQVATLPTA